MKNENASRIIARTYIETNKDAKTAHAGLKKGFPNVPVDLFTVVWNDRSKDKTVDQQVSVILSALGKLQTVAEFANANGYRLTKVTKPAETK
jgi:hypothetical protein